MQVVEAVREMAVKARADNKKLEARIGKLEALIAGSASPTSVENPAAASPKPRSKK